ncbi:MAG: dihydrolipoyllysine-residue succinyltransferase [Chlamydiota bacterium]
MLIEIVVPTIGESITEATVSAFLVQSGSVVSSGQEIMELETDKVNQVLYAPEAGQVTFSVAIGDTVQVGQKVAFLDTEAKVKEPIEVKKPDQPTPVVEEVIKVLPVEKEMPSFVEGKTTRKKMSSLRKIIASKLVEVKNTTAMLTTFNEVDMTSVMDIRTKEKDKFLAAHGVKLGFMSFFVRATLDALRTYPIIHSFIEGDEIVTPNFYDIGIAVSTEKGLVVPVIRQCETLSLGDIEKEIAKQAKKAREGRIAIDDIKGGSFTITNGGVFGSLLSTPIINPSQSAILGMHSIVKRPVALNDQVVIRPMMYLALSYDHRIIDGKEAVLFLMHMKDLLENPSKFLKEGDLPG